MKKTWLEIIDEGVIRTATYPKRVIAYSENHSVSVKLVAGMKVTQALDKAVHDCLAEIELEVAK